MPYGNVRMLDLSGGAVIGLDTNVIVRYVTQDEPLQSAKATAFVEALSSDSPGFITIVSMVELVWVLASCYRATKGQVAVVIETVLRSKELVVERADIIWQALGVYRRDSKADFADCLIERSANAAGCDYIATFDRQAASAGGMRSIGQG